MALLQKPVLPVVIEEEGRKSKGVATCEWSSEAVGALLDSYVEKFALGRGFLRSKDWEEVLTDVNACSENFRSLKTMKQCKDKVDSLKRRYKIEKRKAVNGSTVTWPFFAQIDDMMGSVLKQGKLFEPLEGHEPKPLVAMYRHADEVDEDKLDYSDSHEECGVDNVGGALQNGKASAEEVDDLSENGIKAHMYGHPRKPFTLTRSPQSTDNSSEHIKAAHMQGISEKAHSKKRKVAYDDGMHALANAITGFSDVFARIEIAKMEIFSKMKLEMAKLQRRQRTRSKKKKKLSSPSYSSSG